MRRARVQVRVYDWALSDSGVRYLFNDTQLLACGSVVPPLHALAGSCPVDGPSCAPQAESRLVHVHGPRLTHCQDALRCSQT